MGERDDLLAAVLKIHEAGLDTAKWPDALGALTPLLGGWCALLEVVDLPSRRCSRIHSFSMPTTQLNDYVEHYSSISPRLPHLQHQKPGALCWDYQFVDEASIIRNPYYMEFLAPWDMRYCLGGIVENAPRRMAFAAVQRSPKQGHATRASIDVMAVLMPHVQLAYDVSRRFGTLSDQRGDLEHAVDWLGDGVLVLARDGAVLHANAAAQEIARRGDGLDIRFGTLAFRSADAAAKFGKALDAICRPPGLDVATVADADFVIGRPDLPPLAVSLRPLPRGGVVPANAVALMFVHDPLNQSDASASLLRGSFGLTPAEADLAVALCGGLSVDDYARTRTLSRNTVYTHLRRLKEKTGCTRLVELIRKLNDVQTLAARRLR